MKKDLHIHTNNSDGILSAYEVIDIAKENGVDKISIADHDTVDAYTDEVFSYAKKKNINLVTGVEISTRLGNDKFHVLGYNIDIKNQELINELNSIRNARHIYLHDVAKKLSEHGYKVDVNKLDDIKAVTKAHIARDVISNKENETLLKKEFNHVPTMGDFIETIMSNGCPCYVEKKTLTPKEASDLIKQAGGKVVLAHPVAYKYENNMTEEEITKVALDMKADGLEAIYLYTTKDGKLINAIDIWKKIAEENNMIVTTGSDFHKEEKNKPTIGLINFKI